MRHFTTRRTFLRQALTTSAAAATLPLLAGCSPDGSTGSAGRATPTSLRAGATRAVTEPTGRLLPGAVDDRILVVVDLEGGNDGLSTLIPAGVGTYHDLRPRLALPEEDVLWIDDEVGLHPALVSLHERGITTVEGVGPIDGDLSHFAMTERWERGDVNGANPLRTGFLGRLADTLDDGSPLVGVSLSGPTPHFVSDRAATLAMSNPGQLWFLRSDAWDEVAPYRAGLQAFTNESSDDRWLAALGTASADLLDLADAMPDEDMEIDWDQPMLRDGGWLGQQLFLASNLIQADLGTRVYYARLGGFDTHDDHEWRHPQLMAEVDAAVGGFLERLDTQGVSDRVVVATISEFGRRVPQNGAGLDHGAASTMLVAGPVEARRLGEAPPLDDLDGDDNLATTVSFDQYLATLAEDWLGVEAASVLPGEPRPLGLFA